MPAQGSWAGSGSGSESGSGSGSESGSVVRVRVRIRVRVRVRISVRVRLRIGSEEGQRGAEAARVFERVEQPWQPLSREVVQPERQQAWVCRGAGLDA